MIYYMTAFLLWANQAPIIWWIGFIIVLVLDLLWKVEENSR
jgi:hypothetical protein